MIRIPNRGLHDLISAPHALPIATVKRTYSKNVVPDVLSGKKPAHQPFFFQNNKACIAADTAARLDRTASYSAPTASYPLCHLPNRGAAQTQPASCGAPAA